MSTDLLVKDRQHILAHTQGLWEQLRGRRVFITGGTGFVGSWLLEALSAANSAFNLGAEALLLTRDAKAFRAKLPHLANDPMIDVLEGSAQSFSYPPGSANFQYVIHAATERAFESSKDQPLGIVGGGLRCNPACPKLRRAFWHATAAVHKFRSRIRTFRIGAAKRSGDLCRRARHSRASSSVR